VGAAVRRSRVYTGTMQDNLGTWAGFLVACFLILGIAGLFAAFAAPVPYERALALGADPALREEALRDAAAVAYRLRLMMLVVTPICAATGVGILRLAMRQTPSRTGGQTPG
jgi:hypothetical protein